MFNGNDSRSGRDRCSCPDGGEGGIHNRTETLDGPQHHPRIHSCAEGATQSECAHVASLDAAGSRACTGGTISLAQTYTPLPSPTSSETAIVEEEIKRRKRRRRRRWRRRGSLRDWMTNFQKWLYTILRPWRARQTERIVDHEVEEHALLAKDGKQRPDAVACGPVATGPSMNFTQPPRYASLAEELAAVTVREDQRWFSEASPSLRGTLHLMFWVVLVLVGGGMQILMLNFWIDAYPANSPPGNYTTLLVSSVSFAAFFDIVLLGHWIVDRPSFQFLWCRDGLQLLFLVGTADTMASVLSIYTASRTSVLLQVLFSSTVPLFTAVFQKWILHDQRSYGTWAVFFSFTLITTGVLLGFALQLMSAERPLTDHEDGFQRAGGQRSFVWNLLYFCSVLPTVLQNVWQTEYMLFYTRDPLLEMYVLQRHDAEVTPVATQMSPSIGCAYGTFYGATERSGAIDPGDSGTTGFITAAAAPAEPRRVVYDAIHPGDDITVKLVLLAVDTTIQAVQAFLLLPFDPLWGGGPRTIPESWANLQAGVQCLLNCPRNMLFGGLYCLGFVFTYLGSVYLDERSVTLCAIVRQLSSPCTALLLILFPVLNVTGEGAPWYMSLAATALLTTGALLYTYWDTQTLNEKERYEEERKILRLRPRVVRMATVDRCRDGSGGSPPVGLQH